MRLVSQSSTITRIFRHMTSPAIGGLPISSRFGSKGTITSGEQCEPRASTSDWSRAMRHRRKNFSPGRSTVPQTLCNPLYHWTHLELKRYFGIDELLDESTAESIWERANECLADVEFFRSWHPQTLRRSCGVHDGRSG